MSAMTNNAGFPGEDDPSQARIGDQERNAAVDALSEHYVAGRLDEAEFHDRMDKAMAAKTPADLAPLFADLPSLGPGAPTWQAPNLPSPATDPTPVARTAASQSTIDLAKKIQPWIWPAAGIIFVLSGFHAWQIFLVAVVAQIVISTLVGNRKHGHGHGSSSDGEPPQLPPR